MGENTYKIRKDTVKNAAIVFLSIMLVLTFFSNSILNRALPEVATEYVAYDTITERVRGTGTVTAQDPYKVLVKDSRTIESVAVMEGDMVMKDQVLFYLADSESEELKAKEEEVKAKEAELNKQVLDYMTALLSVDISNAAYLNIQNDNIATVAAYQTQIEASRQKVQSAQDTVDSLNRQILVASMDSEDDIDRDTDLAIATANRDDASKRISEAEAQISSAQATISALNAKALGSGSGTDTEGGDGTTTPDTEKVGESLEITALEAATAYTTANANYKTAKENLVNILSEILVIPDTPDESDDTETPAPAEFNESDYFDGNGFPKSVELLEDLQTVAEDRGASDPFNQFKSAYDTYLLTKKAKEEADADLSNYKSAKSELASAQTALTNATNEFNSYQKKVDRLSDENVESDGEDTELQNSLTLSLEDAKTALEAAQKEQEQLLKDISSELALSSQNDDIAETEEELAELKEELAELQTEATEATVVSPVEGTIISLNKTAGESTSPEEELALIQVAGKGMSLSFSVTNDQAAKVKAGDVAELQNAWYYEDVMVTLSKIKTDPEDPGKKKLLEFTVEGSVQNGESLSLTVGERSAEYDLVVPNSAVREDNNGKFVLIIEEKSTPFGNRYKAKRVDVEVMASDEMKTAVSGDLEGYEYVITTSNQPVQNGDQVRLADY